MTTANLEKPKTLHADTLKNILEKEVYDEARRKALQKTLNQILHDEEKTRILEFSEQEWRGLIEEMTIGEAQNLLKQKIEIQKESQKEENNLISKIQEKGKNTLQKGEEFLQEKGEEMKKSIIEKLNPWEKIRYGFGLAWSTLKLGFFGLLAKTGFNWAKKLYKTAKDKEIQDMISLAREKGLPIPPGFGDATEKKENQTETSEKKIETESLLNKLGFGAAGLALFGVVKHMLPGKTREKIGEDEESLMKNASKFRAFKLLGGAGIGLFGLSMAYNYYAHNPEILDKIGPRPDKKEEQKIWYEKLFSLAGVAYESVAEILETGVDGFTGTALKEKYEQEGLAPGMTYLSDSPLFSEPIRYIKLLTNKIQGTLATNPKEIALALAGMGIVFGGDILSLGLKAGDIVQKILQTLYGNAKKNPVLWALGLAAGAGGAMNGWEALKHIQVKENMTQEDLEDLVTGVRDLDDGEIEKYTGIEVSPDVSSVMESVGTNGERLAAEIRELFENFKDKCSNTLRERFEIEQHEKISGANTSGLESMMIKIKDQKLDKFQGNDSSQEYRNLFGEKFDGGKITEMITKSKNKKLLTEGDVHNLIQATRGTNIRIFPEGGDRENAHTIQWAIIEENGEVGLPQNLCVNPAKSLDKQENIAEEFSPDTVVEWGKITTGVYNTLRYDLVSELSKALLNRSGEKRGICEKMIAAGFTFVIFGTKILAQYGTSVVTLGQADTLENIFSGKDMEAKEMLVNYAGSLVPVLVVTTLKNAAFGINRGMGKFLGNTICETVTYPLQSIRAGKYILDKFRKGDLAGILRDPKMVIRDGIGGLAKRMTGWTIEKTTGELLGKNLRTKGQLQKWTSMLHSIKIDTEIGKSPDKLHNQFKALQEFFQKHDHLQKALGMTAAEFPNINHSNLDSLLRGAKNSLQNFDDIVKRGLPEVAKELANVYEKEIAQKFPEANYVRRKYVLDTLAGKEKEMNDLESEKKTLEKRVYTAEKSAKKNPTNQTLRDSAIEAAHDLADFQKDFPEKQMNIRAQMKALHSAQHISIHAPEVSKHGAGIKARGRGLLLIAGIFGAGYAINKVSAAIHGESREEDYAKEDIDFYGYKAGADSNRDTREMEEAIDKNSEADISYECETYDEFKQRVEMVENEYREEMTNFMQKEWTKKASHEDAKILIDKLSLSHVRKVAEMKKLVKANKALVTQYGNEKFVGDVGEEIIPQEFRDKQVTAFMFITKKHGKLVLESMNQADFSRTLFALYNDMHLSQAAQIGIVGVKTGLSTIPYAGNAVALYDAKESFSEGDIRGGLWNLGWCVGGLALDIISGGTVGTAVRVAKAARAATHAGITLSLQTVQEISKIPRTESIEIENL